MTIVRIGSNKKFADGWGAAFSKSKKKKTSKKVAGSVKKKVKKNKK